MILYVGSVVIFNMCIRALVKGILDYCGAFGNNNFSKILIHLVDASIIISLIIIAIVKYCH